MALKSDILSSDSTPMMGGEIVLYQPDDDSIRLEVRMESESVWLNQQQMGELFNTDRTSILRHVHNIYATKELEEASTCAKIAQVRLEGNRMVNREIPYYNLDMIIAIGYRVNSIRGTRFRQWATSKLKEYMLRGYVFNQRLLNVEHQLAEQKSILLQHQEKIDFFVHTNLPPIEQVFFDGDFWEARVLLETLIKMATKRVVIIDNYIDTSVFSMLDVRNKGVEAIIYSHKDFADLRDLHNAQPNVEPIETFVWTKPSHDRWLIVDDMVYHCGHSLKDMGKKLCAIMRMGCDAETILNQVR